MRHTCPLRTVHFIKALLVNCALNPLIGIDRWMFFVEWKWSKTCWELVSRDFFFCFRSPHVTTRDPFSPADSTNNQSLHNPSFMANTMSWNHQQVSDFIKSIPMHIVQEPRAIYMAKWEIIAREFLTVAYIVLDTLTLFHMNKIWSYSAWSGSLKTPRYSLQHIYKKDKYWHLSKTETTMTCLFSW